jgi:hypothetical protein
MIVIAVAIVLAAARLATTTGVARIRSRIQEVFDPGVTYRFRLGRFRVKDGFLCRRTWKRLKFAIAQAFQVRVKRSKYGS